MDVGEAIRGDGRKVQVLGRRPGPRARRAVDACESHRRLVRAAVADVWGLAALDDASSHEGRMPLSRCVQRSRISLPGRASQSSRDFWELLLPRQARHASSAQHRLPSPRPWHRRPGRAGWQCAIRGPRRRPRGLGCGRRCAATKVIATRAQTCRFIRVVKYFQILVTQGKLANEL